MAARASRRLARAAMTEFDAAREAMLAAERVLAAELGEPYAVPLEFPVQWDIGAPLPHLIQSDYQTFLLFWLRDTEFDLRGALSTLARSSVRTTGGAGRDFHYAMLVTTKRVAKRNWWIRLLHAKPYAAWCRLQLNRDRQTGPRFLPVTVKS